MSGTLAVTLPGRKGSVSSDRLTICSLPVSELSPDHLDWDMAWGADPFLAEHAPPRPV